MSLLVAGPWPPLLDGVVLKLELLSIVQNSTLSVFIFSWDSDQRNEHWNPWLLGSSLVARTSKLGQTNKPKKEPKSEILEEKPGKIQ